MGFEMPERQERDGAVGVGWEGTDSIRISAADRGEMSSMVVGKYNAARILVMLCMMLEVPPPKALGKLKM